MALAIALAGALGSAGAEAIPPSIAGDEERIAQAQAEAEQREADLQSREARALLDLFFARMGEGEAFPLGELFLPNASYFDGDENRSIAENADHDGFPDIAQWQPIAVFRLADSLAASASHRLEPLGIREAVLKFHFARDASGALKIAWIEEVEL
jgi:hypothetical protein